MLCKMNLSNVFFIILLAAGIAACKGKHAADEKVIVATPEEMDDRVSENIQSVLLYASDNNGNINEKQKLNYTSITDKFYNKNNYRVFWSTRQTWLPMADSMFHFIKTSRYSGLYPEDLHFNALDTLWQQLEADSLVRMDAIAWTKAELLLTDAFMRALKEMKEGRLVPDSNSIVHRQNFVDSFFVNTLSGLRENPSVNQLMEKVEPSQNE